MAKLAAPSPRDTTPTTSPILHIYQGRAKRNFATKNPITGIISDKEIKGK
jgi:hypothetical protein